MTDPAPADHSPVAPQPAPRVVIVDGDDRTRESLCRLLGIRSQLDVVGSTGLVGEVVPLIRATSPDAVLIDPRLPELARGISVIRAIHAFRPEVRIVAMAPTAADESTVLAAGAHAFVRKTFRTTELVEAVARCLTLRATAADGAEPVSAQEGLELEQPAVGPGSGWILW